MICRWAFFCSARNAKGHRDGFLPQLEADGIGLLGAALFVEDQYLPDRALQVALDQVALLQDEVETTPQLMLCRSFADI